MFSYETARFANTSRTSSSSDSTLFTLFTFTTFTIAFFSNSIEFEVAELNIESIRKDNAKARIVEFLYDEESELNKRSFVDFILVLSLIRTQISVQFEAEIDDRFKRKKQKKIDRRTESMSLVRMFNDFIEKYDFSIFIREVLQRNKMNIF